MYRIRAPESCDIVRLHLAAALSAGSQCSAPHGTARQRCFGCLRHGPRLSAQSTPLTLKYLKHSLACTFSGCCGTVGTAFAECARCDRSKPKPLEYLKSVLDIKQKYAYLVDHALGKNTRSVHRPVPTRQHRLL